MLLSSSSRHLLLRRRRRRRRRRCPRFKETAKRGNANVKNCHNQQIDGRMDRRLDGREGVEFLSFAENGTWGFDV